MHMGTSLSFTRQWEWTPYSSRTMCPCLERSTGSLRCSIPSLLCSTELHVCPWVLSGTRCKLGREQASLIYLKFTTEHHKFTTAVGSSALSNPMVSPRDQWCVYWVDSVNKVFYFRLWLTYSWQFLPPPSQYYGINHQHCHYWKSQLNKNFVSSFNYIYLSLHKLTMCIKLITNRKSSQWYCLHVPVLGWGQKLKRSYLTVYVLVWVTSAPLHLVLLSWPP